MDNAKKALQLFQIAEAIHDDAISGSMTSVAEAVMKIQHELVDLGMNPVLVQKLVQQPQQLEKAVTDYKNALKFKKGEFEAEILGARMARLEAGVVTFRYGSETVVHA